MNFRLIEERKTKLAANLENGEIFMWGQTPMMRVYSCYREGQIIDALRSNTEGNFVLAIELSDGELQLINASDRIEVLEVGELVMSYVVEG